MKGKEQKHSEWIRAMAADQETSPWQERAAEAIRLSGILGQMLERERATREKLEAELAKLHEEYDALSDRYEEQERDLEEISARHEALVRSIEYGCCDQQAPQA